MKLEKRINAFRRLGERLLSFVNIPEPEHRSAIQAASEQNPWFTPENITLAIKSIARPWLSEQKLNDWVSGYPESYFYPDKEKNIGVIMAGNIPLVGFHDFLCVLISGHRFVGKVSSKDAGLMQLVSEMLCDIEPQFRSYIELTDSILRNFDAVIATGSDSTRKHFSYYFKDYPTVIRGHRNSIAVLSGNESDKELQLLGNDIFTYFGLGCRNVSKLLVPSGYRFDRLFRNIESWKKLLLHHKYANNYEYQRAMLTMNRHPHLDNGFLLLLNSESIDTPIGVVNYSEYTSPNEPEEFIRANRNRIQCCAAHSSIVPEAIPFGTTQTPPVTEYADGIDTINFLANL